MYNIYEIFSPVFRSSKLGNAIYISTCNTQIKLLKIRKSQCIINTRILSSLFRSPKLELYIIHKRVLYTNIYSCQLFKWVPDLQYVYDCCSTRRLKLVAIPSQPLNNFKSYQHNNRLFKKREEKKKNRCEKII